MPGKKTYSLNLLSNKKLNELYDPLYSSFLRDFILEKRVGIREMANSNPLNESEKWIESEPIPISFEEMGINMDNQEKEGEKEKDLNRIKKEGLVYFAVINVRTPGVIEANVVFTMRHTQKRIDVYAKDKTTDEYGQCDGFTFSVADIDKIQNDEKEVICTSTTY